MVPGEGQMNRVQMNFRAVETILYDTVMVDYIHRFLKPKEFKHWEWTLV